MAVPSLTAPVPPRTTPSRAPRQPRVSSVLLKAVMAVTGLALFGFVVAHMVGNLKIFFGQESFDTYARFLRTVGEPLVPERTLLWIMRIGLLVAVFAHIGAATALARRARKARPVRYAHRPKVQGSYAARTMRWGGVIIALFVLYHLADLTLLWLNPHGVHGEAYRNVTADFQYWHVTLIYTAAVLTLGFHLRHGVWSALRSLGRGKARTEARLKAVALGTAVLVCAGYLSVPFAVITGLVS
ncbi:succinate dehydrogenase / fumarate reductase cytochrome b subunit [Crossiella equi]|uniref:Succinate dehydrogenase / fumarate reductase cytochrome b subunit n=1 Tax=Crossiella equi TaxID=130796 RepID=A0ABS5A9D7_9PSEU|nr:succinate dehydrogenase cytochrome b subunit [Crossiella equi]MBP2473191.1 succinate dehydrogenase / fumarate reductase cytochrome b subunit [Crossiella equi]